MEGVAESIGSQGFLEAPLRNSGSSAAGAVRAAAKLSIEMGKATLWISVVATSFAVFLHLHGASRRGRDLFDAAAGACLVTPMKSISASRALALLSAPIFGVGLIQSRGRVAS